VATKELIVAPRTAASSHVVELAPVKWSEPKDSMLIRAATRAGEVRRVMSRAVHDVRYRPPRRRTAKMLILIPAHDEEASIGNVLNSLLTQTRVPDRIVVIADTATTRPSRSPAASAASR
jgi:hypothetical protein